jgi:hypothetical protein
MRKRVILIFSSLLVLVYLGWALSPLWKPVVYGKAPRFSICFVVYDCGPSGPNESAGKVEFGKGLELSDKSEIDFSFNTFWGKTVDTKFAFKLPRYGNEHEVRMQILPESRTVGAIAWDDSVDAMSYVLSGMSPQEWAASKGLRWLELKAGDEWSLSLKEKTLQRILLVCERTLEPDAPAGTQPYGLVGVQLQAMEK